VDCRLDVPAPLLPMAVSADRFRALVVLGPTVGLRRSSVLRASVSACRSGLAIRARSPGKAQDRSRGCDETRQGRHTY